MRESASSSSKPLPGVRVEQRAVLLREPVALAGQLLGRPLDVLAGLQRGDVADQRRVRDRRVVQPAPVVVVEAVAGGHVEPRILDLLELGQPGTARLASGQLALDLLGRPALGEHVVDAGVDRQAREPAELGVGLPEDDVDARDHLRDVLVGDVGQVALAELAERHVRAVAEQQELAVVLPHQVAQAERAAVGVEHVVEAQVAVVLEDDLARLVLRQVRHLELGQLADHRLDLHAPLRVELVPVGEVVARALLEVLRPARRSSPGR